MKKLLLILIISPLFGDLIVFGYRGGTHTNDNVKFSHVGNGEMYFEVFGCIRHKDCSAVLSFIDNEDNPIDYDCSVILDRSKHNRRTS